MTIIIDIANIIKPLHTRMTILTGIKHFNDYYYGHFMSRIAESGALIIPESEHLWLRDKLRFDQE